MPFIVLAAHVLETIRNGTCIIHTLLYEVLSTVPTYNLRCNPSWTERGSQWVMYANIQRHHQQLLDDAPSRVLAPCTCCMCVCAHFCAKIVNKTIAKRAGACIAGQLAVRVHSRDEENNILCTNVCSQPTR